MDTAAQLLQSSIHTAVDAQQLTTYVEDATSTAITLVVNWTTALKK